MPPDLGSDPVELVILSLLADAPLYGYAISKRVAARSGGDLKVGPAVLYPLLAKLEKQGLITSTWETIRSDRAPAGDGGDSQGRRRKWYRLSPKGKRRLADRIAAHRAYAALIESFIAGRAMPETTE